MRGESEFTSPWHAKWHQEADFMTAVTFVKVACSRVRVLTTDEASSLGVLVVMVVMAAISVTSLIESSRGTLATPNGLGSATSSIGLVVDVVVVDDDLEAVY
jgi:hypothetical protein